MNTPNSSNNRGQGCLGRTGTPKVGKMVEQILERGDHGEEFQRDFQL